MRPCSEWLSVLEVPRYLTNGASAFAAVSGMLTTALGLVVAFVPSRQVDSFWRFEAKMFACCIALLGLAAVLFSYYSRQRVAVPALPVEA